MVRMQDVAERANVSIATVSFVVNGTKRVSEATRARVESAMTELGFTRNVLARALASRRSRIIALLFPELDTRGNASAMEFVHGASVGAAERDHHLVLWPVANDPAALREYLDGGLVDGVLAMEVQLEDPRVPMLEAAGIPFVLIGRTADPSAYAYADIDFETTAHENLDHLAGLGHERIALVLEHPGALGESAYGPPVRLERAYREWAVAHGATAVVAMTARDPAGGAELAEDLLRDHPDVTAVLIANDEAAPGLLRGIRATGRSVPRDVSVLALGMASRTAALCEPPLVHSAPPGYDLGHAAARALIDLVEDADAEPIRTLLPCVLGEGASVAPVRTTLP
ncbi:LacI family DNA-binding transcriptional regulator [Amnibacterium setariae]|nr:LacI family DNA-binding transcriptional regulator [Amnibacterium setariae]